MSAWTVDDVRAIAPEFTVPLASDVLVAAWIVRTARRIDEDTWGEKAIDGGAYLTAHLMVVSGVGPYAATGGAGAGASGAVTGITVGQVSVTYSEAVSTILTGQPSLRLSKYGLMYAELLSELMLNVMVL